MGDSIQSGPAGTTQDNWIDDFLTEVLVTDEVFDMSWISAEPEGEGSY